MRVLPLTAAALAVLLTPQAAGAASEGKEEKAKKERVVCKTTMVTGSRFDRRVCKTKAEWDNQAEKHSDRWREELQKPVSPANLGG